jgi:hypothetical protein
MAQKGPQEEDKPPFFKTWRTLYWLVIGALLAQIILFYGITRYFA